MNPPLHNPVHDPQTRQTIVRLLSSMASAKEISQYLKRFSQLDAKRFAVVKVGGAVLRDDLEALTSSLAFLQQVGLTPIVIHGAGPQLDAELSAAGLEKVTRDGLRVAARKMRGVFEVAGDDLGIRDDRDGGPSIPSLARANRHDRRKRFYTARMPEPARRDAPPDPVETNMTAIYVRVVVVEVIVLLSLYWLQRVYS